VDEPGRAEDGDPGSHHERDGAGGGAAARPAPAAPRPPRRAIDAVDWHLADKRGKRVWSRGLRLLAIALVTAGALQPLLDWAAECARSAARTVDPKQVQNRLALLRAFSDDVAALLQQVTAFWVLEFQSNLLRLERSNRASSGSVPLHGTAEP
jgi:hypothetical protein